MSQSSQASISIVSAVRNGVGSVQVRGTASPGATATVNGTPVTIAADGSWSLDLPAGPGPTRVDATVVSADGSSRSSSSITVSS